MFLKFIMAFYLNFIFILSIINFYFRALLKTMCSRRCELRCPPSVIAKYKAIHNTDMQQIVSYLAMKFVAVFFEVPINH